MNAAPGLRVSIDIRLRGGAVRGGWLGRREEARIVVEDPAEERVLAPGGGGVDAGGVLGKPEREPVGKAMGRGEAFGGNGTGGQPTLCESGMANVGGQNQEIDG